VRRWLTLVVVGVGAAAAIARADSIDDQVTTGWREVAPHEVGWMPERTPLLPSVFPIVKGAPLVAYAYALRTGDVADGVRVTAPWAEITVTRSGEVSRKSLGRALKMLGIQGVWAVDSSTVPTAVERHDANAWIIRQTGGAAPPAVRKVYCQWSSGNGLIARALPAPPNAFLASLHCAAK
jgi:hypothetical protein